MYWRLSKVHKKAASLIEALPYIQKFYGKIVVIKYGGSIMGELKLKRSLLKDIVLLKYVGINPVIIHGGGPGINKEMARRSIEPKFVDGLRVTDAKTVKIVKRVLGKYNDEICRTLKRFGVEAVGLYGTDYNLIQVKVTDKKLGYVGDVKKIKTSVLNKIIKQGKIPVITPIGRGSNGKDYNINADSAATALAVELGAEKLTILTDVDGVSDGKKLITHLSINEAEKLIKEGIIKKGMIPKVRACTYAVQHGVPKAHLLNGLKEHTLFMEVFTQRGVGTEIVKNSENGS
jgi:acetylglutamate kinase